MKLKYLLAHPKTKTRINQYYRWYPKSLTKYDQTVLEVDSEIDGFYIHVPFCDKLCSFCPFIKGIFDQEQIDLFVKAIIVEIHKYSKFVKASRLKFIYFGGGSPSVLNGLQFEMVLAAISSHWYIDSFTEISVEVHPSHAETNKLKSIKEIGVTRISMGIQSFDANNLIQLGATHNASVSHSAVDTAMNIFENVAIDLLYSYQGQTLDAWSDDLTLTIEKGIPHLSCYPIIPTSQQISQQTTEQELTFAMLALKFTRNNKYRPYASCASGGFDTCLDGFKSNYELLHWQSPQAKFIGLGPGAFGYLGTTTTANLTRIRDYIAVAGSDKHLALASAHTISVSEAKHRYFALGIKTYVIPFRPYIEQFGEAPFILFSRQFDELERLGFAKIMSDKLILTEIGRLFVDDCSEIFFSKDEANIPHPEELELAQLIKRKSNA